MKADENLTIILCIPGNNFSGNFLKCWTNLLSECSKIGIHPVLSTNYSNNIYYVRNMCLGGNIANGPSQKPFNGRLDYDYLMWIDSDILFDNEQVLKLLSHNLDVVSGLYLLDDNTHFATCRTWDEEFFKENGYFPFLKRGNLSDNNALFEVAYTGFGFILIKKGVFEALEYPWFRPIYKRIGHSVDFTMEDVAFCLNAQKKGFKVMVDPTVIVGHEKSIVLTYH